MGEKIKIIYEDDEVLVLDKPANVVVTKERVGEVNTIEDYLREIRPNKLSRSGIVHRLDKGTSGVLLAAKTEESLNELKRQFKERLVKKKYLAMICGETSLDGEIDVPIGRSRYGFGKFGVSTEGKRAISRFKTIDKYKKNGRIYSLIEIELLTGRTHQIRVHFSYLKWPLLGDRLYGGEVSDLNRPFLHAKEIKFIHPTEKNWLNFKSELADDLKIILANYEKI